MAEIKTPIARGQNATHTPLPWRQSSLAPLYLIAGDDPEPICSMGEYGEQGDIDHIFDNAPANTEFILRAVNSHQDLLDACKYALKRCEENGFPHGDLAIRLRATIEKAEADHS